PSVVAAIESAIAMQTLMAERNDQLPTDRIMQFRMGVHMGDVIADEDEVFGDDVNIAVRLESVATAGGVAVSAKAYQEVGKNLTARLIAREIDATYLIQGSVRRAGSKIRVTAELIAPENGEQLWTGRYDRDMGDLFALQDEITTSLSAALAPEIFRAEASAPARSSSADLTAWDRFLKGLSHYYQQTEADFEASIALFREAIALDPGLAI